MNINEKEALKAAMIEKLTELETTIAELKKDTQPMGLDSAIGRISRMDYINNKAVSEASLRKAENDISALHRWIDLYSTDRFAKCVKCGIEINPKRLLLIPASTKCINCAKQ